MDFYAFCLIHVFTKPKRELQRRGIKGKRLHEEIYAKYMETHIRLGMDAVRNLEIRWAEVERKLTSEW